MTILNPAPARIGSWAPDLINITIRVREATLLLLLAKVATTREDSATWAAPCRAA